MEDTLGARPRNRQRSRSPAFSKYRVAVKMGGPWADLVVGERIRRTPVCMCVCVCVCVWEAQRSQTRAPQFVPGEARAPDGQPTAEHAPSSRRAPQLPSGDCVRSHSSRRHQWSTETARTCTPGESHEPATGVASQWLSWPSTCMPLGGPLWTDAQRRVLTSHLGGQHRALHNPPSEELERSHRRAPASRSSCGRTRSAVS